MSLVVHRKESDKINKKYYMLNDKILKTNLIHLQISKTCGTITLKKKEVPYEIDIYHSG